jgi:hypothetical protein
MSVSEYLYGLSEWCLTKYVSCFPITRDLCFLVPFLIIQQLSMIWKSRYSNLLWDWLIDYLGFYVPLKNFSLIWRRHHCRWRAAKFRPMLGAQGLWAGRDLYRTTPAVTRGLGCSGLIRRTAPFSRLVRHTRGCGGSILTRILTGRSVEKKYVLMLSILEKIIGL